MFIYRINHILFQKSYFNLLAFLQCQAEIVIYLKRSPHMLRSDQIRELVDHYLKINSCYDLVKLSFLWKSLLRQILSSHTRIEVWSILF